LGGQITEMEGFSPSTEFSIFNVYVMGYEKGLSRFALCFSVAGHGFPHRRGRI
jgi:hypothetical protein